MTQENEIIFLYFWLPIQIRHGSGDIWSSTLWIVFDSIDHLNFISATDKFLYDDCKFWKTWIYYQWRNRLSYKPMIQQNYSNVFKRDFEEEKNRTNTYQWWYVQKDFPNSQAMCNLSSLTLSVRQLNLRRTEMILFAYRSHKPTKYCMLWILYIQSHLLKKRGNMITIKSCSTLPWWSHSLVPAKQNWIPHVRPANSFVVRRCWKFEPPAQTHFLVSRRRSSEFQKHVFLRHSKLLALNIRSSESIKHNGIEYATTDNTLTNRIYMSPVCLGLWVNFWITVHFRSAGN